MAAIGWFGYARLAYFSQPQHERMLYKQIRKQPPQRIVEVGIGSTERAVQLIRVAQRYRTDSPISYTGFDCFEERPAGAAPLPLIHAHRQLQLTGARVRLVPGFPAATLPQLANSLQRTDMMLISSDVDDASLEKAWFYMPRMCHEQTLVLRELRVSDEQSRFELISQAELQRRAEVRTKRAA
ncbi:hypothetical protein [Aeoliella mucimassa]|uniref:Leucine carboxyl methyltransferase n=1 Tax=Aeoliella mucimassa TaxID=2527972 RepID=A0A518ARQ6_9BACT|nr:hypothetical protein [Aeoliella mucimassa]QDU57413.1 hypothetical protein Pan181_36290 [Aeoliella mucimassa]